ncbi:hypothetical protein [Streptomyces poonensis]|uniref:hypothetical protein n=1 Tax=Streptomyces poonensis TaxID=68255 RepID=UPI0022F2EE0A|nr:hypothetical protein [Streptomyces poonensis]
MALFRHVDDVRAVLGTGGVGLVIVEDAGERGQHSGGVVEVDGVDDEAGRCLTVVPLTSGGPQGEGTRSGWAREVGEALYDGVEVVAGLDGRRDAGIVALGVLLLDHVAVAVPVLMET